MKKFLFICLILCNIHVFAQSSLKFSINGGSFSDPNLSGLYGYDSIYSSIDQLYPFLTGLHIEYAINPAWSILAAYQYNYRYLRISVFSESVGEFFNGVQMHTSEIPLLVKYTHSFPNLNEATFYCQLGLSLDYMYVPVNTFWKDRVIDLIFAKETWVSYYILNLPLKLIPATVAEIGISNSLGKAGDLEIGLQWHRQIPALIGNEIIYYHKYGSGSPTNQSMEHFVRSSYFAFNINYCFPWKIKFNSKK